jgi:hypothetical protein
MTAPDRIQITHRPRTMTTPDFRTLCAELLQAWQFGDDIAGPMNRARTALKAEPEGESPRPRGDWFTVAMIAQDMRSRGLAEQVVGEELLKLANSNRSQPGRPATQPAPEKEEGPTLADVDELCAQFGFHYDDDQGEALETLRDMILASLARWGPPSAAAPEPGEVAVPEPVAECPHCGYEGEMVPAPQAGEVEA